MVRNIINSNDISRLSNESKVLLGQAAFKNAKEVVNNYNNKIKEAKSGSVYTESGTKFLSNLITRTAVPFLPQPDNNPDNGPGEKLSPDMQLLKDTYPGLYYLLEKANTGDIDSVNELMQKVADEDIGATECLKALDMSIYKNRAQKGSTDDLRVLISLSYYGDIKMQNDAKEYLRAINPYVFKDEAEAGSAKTLDNLEGLAENGNKDAYSMLKDAAGEGKRYGVRGLIYIVLSGNPELGNTASDFLNSINLEQCSTEANQGNVNSIGILLDLKDYYGNLEGYGSKVGDIERYLTELNLNPLKANTEAGSIDAAKMLFELGRYGYVADDYIKALDPRGLLNTAKNDIVGAVDVLTTLIDYNNKEALNCVIELAESGHYEAMVSLEYCFINKQNKEAFDCLKQLAKNGNSEANSVLRDSMNAIASRLFADHIYGKVSLSQTMSDLNSATFGNDPFVLYALYAVGDEIFGDLSKNILSLLKEASPKTEAFPNGDIIALVKTLDPEQIFLKDFFLQAANFNALKDMIHDETSMESVIDVAFKMQDQDIPKWALRLSLFTEDVLKSPDFNDELKTVFQNYLLKTYNGEESTSLQKYFVACLMVQYRDQMTAIPEATINDIQAANEINFIYKNIPDEKPGQKYYIIYADEDAVNGHLENGKALLINENVVIVDMVNNIQYRLENGKVISENKEFNFKKELEADNMRFACVRGHTGKEADVLSEASNKECFVFLSLCRSATKISGLKVDFPNTEFAGGIGTVKGGQTDEELELMLPALINNKEKGIETYRELRDYVYEGISDVDTKNAYIWPDDPATQVLDKILEFINKENGGDLTNK